MNSETYEIVHFRPDLRDGVLKVLAHLWGNDLENNRSYFDWKYSLNPYVEKVLGIVALHENKVVGFRGYFATRWKLSEPDKEVVILCPGDTCVDPKHRRKNLSMLMGKLAMEDYAQSYPVFFNFSSNNQSTPGYLKMGFAPLASKGYLNHYTLWGLIRYIRSSGQKGKEAGIAIPMGDFGDIEVSRYPKPAQMAGLVSGQVPSGRRIVPDQDENFFQWRFNNQRKKYVFYYCKKGNGISGYMVVRVLPKNKRGLIIDYAAQDDISAAKLVSFPIRNRHFNVLSISAYSVTDSMAAVVKNFKFKSQNILRTIEKKIEGEWPLLVRPVKKDPKEQDFFIGGVDIRNFLNWSIKEICSDGS
ncbi:MAG: hypothetical protein WA081_08520 [Desulfosalsimonadaceae bacterium]